MSGLMKTSEKNVRASMRRPGRMTRLVSTLLCGTGLLSLGCSSVGEEEKAPPEPIAKKAQLLPGEDGSVTVTAANTVLNQYAALASNVAAGATSLTVTNAADLDSTTFGPLAAGDLLMVVQMRGASINTTNTVNYGSVTALNNAGNYEYVGVQSVAGNVITLGCATQNAYTASGNVQIVRVPQVDNLTIGASGSVTAPAWDGSRGGIVAVHATNNINVLGGVVADALGFRGGATDNSTANGQTGYRGAAASFGGEKGEGIAGYQAVYDALNGRYGRGAPANAGGGGNNHNAGGGGGSNARFGAAWTGQGVMLGTVTGAAAWLLDPGYIANGNALTDSEGGGRGGYSWSNSNQDALVVAPGNNAWAGDNRREVGGLGGRPLDPAANGRLYLGGGGGAGDGNNGAAGRGGNGGGMIFMTALGQIVGTGSISADGEQGGVSAGNPGDAPGGGGGGGTVVLNAAVSSSLTISADGGAGGNQTLSATNEAEGPGGGGGGGYVAIRSGSPTRTAAGAPGGTSNRPSVTEFPTNGATAGNNGLANAVVTTIPYCTEAAAPDTSFLTTEPDPTSDPTGDFTFASTENFVIYRCSIDNGPFFTCPQTYSTPALSDGSHNLRVRAQDLSGNVDPTPASYTWVVDTAPPDTTIPTTEPDPTNDPTGDFAFGSNESGVTYECRVDGAAFAACTQTFSTAALADGSHTIDVRAVDGAGNVDPTPASYTWTVDTAPPDTTIPTTEPNPTNDTTGDFAFGSNESPVTYECRVDGAAFAACTQTFSTAPLSGGSHTIDVRAIDAAGNVDPTPASYTWVVATAAPDTTIITSEPDPTNDPTGDFAFGSDQSPVTYQCSINGGTFTDCPQTYSTPALPDGSYTIAVRARNSVGVLDPTPATYTWTVDTAPPDTNFVTTEPNPTTDPTGDFAFGSNESPVTYECSIDGGTFTACTQTFSTPALAAGSHTISVRATDAAGNVDPTPATYTWTVTAAPTDTDGDGLPDTEETTIGTDPNDADSDDDGVIDGDEPSYDVDSDGDGLINALDPDSDNDGIFDGTELGITTPNADTDVSKGVYVPDADSNTKTDPLKKDTDAGSVPDGAEDTNHNGKIDTGERDPNNPADDVTKPTDTDGDGLSDDEEKLIGTDPNDADTDDDGVIDGDEPNPTADTDLDGLINALDPDSDDDGLFDGTELGLGCSNPATDVSKKRCIPDGDSGTTKTSPLNPDTDGGGATDGSEDANLNGVVDAGEQNPTTGNEADDTNVVDTDGDGLSDGLEATLRSNPNDKDTDDDGVVDGAESNPSDDTDGDGLVNVLDVDSDNDALFDGTEVGVTTADADTDTTKNFFVADGDPNSKTSALNPDTDGGGVRDGSEDVNLNGVVDTGELDPNVGADDTTVVDTDGDGLSDGLESTLNSNPNDDDSDDDGALDGEEANLSADTDGDGTINVLDSDSDADGLFDGTELGNDCSNPDTDTTKNACTADADSGATRTSMVNPDTDFGGVSDGDEDVSKNGAVDAGERDPLDPADDTVVPDGGTGGAGGAAGSAGAAGSGAAGAGGQVDGGAGTGGAGTGGSSANNPLNDYDLEGGGCSCRAAGGDSRTPLWLGALAALGFALIRRRRR